MLNNKEIAALRREYTLETFDESDVLDNPLDQFNFWFKEAVEAEVNEPNAMALATAGLDGKPSVRTVLLKGIINNGFVFYTNYNSNKGKQIKSNPNGALLFFWPELQRQISIEGSISYVSEKDADEYFHSRPFESRIGAYASAQSQPLANRKVLEEKFEFYKTLFEKEPLKRPESWGGYILNPYKIEFWQGRASRLHDRFLFSLYNNTWKRERLYP